MEFRILGPLEVVSDGQVLDLGGQKQRALLAMLLVEANRVVSSDRLIEALWEAQPPLTARKALHVYVSRFRKLLGKERLQTLAGGYRLCVQAEEFDLARFERLREAGRLHEALALWRGAPLAEFHYDRFAQAEIARLEELRLACQEERLERDLARGRASELVGELEALIRQYPLRERLRGQLMLALYRSGRQAEALDAYQAARTTLVEELGIEPSPELRDLHQAILRQDPRLDLATAVEPTAETRLGVFVGREPEVAQLRAALDDAVGGRGRLFLLVGEPGIGKSRLADEAIRHARGRGVEVLVGRCWEAGGAPAYWPWIQALRSYIRETEPEALRAQLAGAADIVQIVPELHDLFPDLPEPPALESDGARFRLFESMTSFLKRAAEARPLLLVLDDLHAADVPSLLLLQFLARELGESRMLVVGGCRDVDPSPTDPLASALTELVGEPVTRSVALAGLGERDVARFIELTAGEAPSDELVATIYEETEGNPLFVGEIVRLLAAEGGLEEAAGLPLLIPQSVRAVISRRLRHLSRECNRVLVLASVLGREFALDALARLGGVSVDQLLATLDEAMSARVVSDVPGRPGHLCFTHILVRDTLYEQLTTARRLALHRLAVVALEALYGEERGRHGQHHLAELAHHAIAGSDFDKGLFYAQRAGDRALALLAYEEAARLYKTALESLEVSDSDDERARCELLLSLAEAQVRAGDTPAARAASLEAAGIARSLGLRRELARAAVGYGGRIVSERAGGDDRLVPLLEEGLAAVAVEDVELRARLLARLAGALRDEHSRDRREGLSREGVEMARRTANPAALVYALAGRGAAIFAPDTVAERLALGSELRDLAERIGDSERVLQAHYYRFSAQLQVGDAVGAEADLTAAIRIADQLRQPAQLWAVCAARAMLALAAGRLREADELVLQALALGERAQPGMAIPAYRLQRYALCDFLGRLQEVESMIFDSVAAYQARPVFACALAHLYAKLGRLPEAKRALADLAANDFSALPFDVEWLYGLSLLAETCSLLSDGGSAAVLYGLLLPYAGQNVVDAPEGIRGSVSRYLGLLATAMDRWSEAAQHFENALAMNAKMGARPWLAYTQEDYARILLVRDSAADRVRGQKLLDTARATYNELGLASHAAQASKTTSNAILDALETQPRV